MVNVLFSQETYSTYYLSLNDELSSVVLSASELNALRKLDSNSSVSYFENTSIRFLELDVDTNGLLMFEPYKIVEDYKIMQKRHNGDLKIIKKKLKGQDLILSSKRREMREIIYVLSEIYSSKNKKKYHFVFAKLQNDEILYVFEKIIEDRSIGNIVIIKEVKSKLE